MGRPTFLSLRSSCRVDGEQVPERTEQMIGLAHEALHGNVDPEYATYTALIGATLVATSMVRLPTVFAAWGQDWTRQGTADPGR